MWNNFAESLIVSETPDGEQILNLRAHQKCFDDLPAMLAPELQRSIAESGLEMELAHLFADPRWTSLVTKLMAINVAFKGPFHILHKVDALSAAFGTVARSIFCSHTFGNARESQVDKRKSGGRTGNPRLRPYVATRRKVGGPAFFTSPPAAPEME